MNKCKQCGKSCQNEYCFSHKPRKRLRTNKPQIYTSEKSYNQYGNAMKMQVFFQKIWNKRLHRSEVSGTNLGKEALSIFFHHILSKDKYPKLKYIEENIILLALDEHANVESNMYKYEEINTRRELLKAKYNI